MTSVEGRQALESTCDVPHAIHGRLQSNKNSKNDNNKKMLIIFRFIIPNKKKEQQKNCFMRRRDKRSRYQSQPVAWPSNPKHAKEQKIKKN